MRSIHGLDGYRALVGQELGLSDWHLVTQERINAFASATDDYEQIHLDPVRAAEMPWGVTIAHGLFTLALGPKFLYEMYTIDGVSRWLNYGFDRVRWLSPVPVNSRVRMRADVLSARDIPGGAVFTVRQTFELDGQDKPACVADSLSAYFD
jgi:acyl dehydratase